MGLQKRKRSRAIENADMRLNMMKKLADEHPEINAVFSVEDYARMHKKTQLLFDEYNNALSRLRALNNELKTAEKKLSDLNERAPKAIIAMFGRDSTQYMAMGGKMKSEIKGYRPETFDPDEDLRE